MPGSMRRGNYDILQREIVVFRNYSPMIFTSTRFRRQPSNSP